MRVSKECDHKYGKIFIKTNAYGGGPIDSGHWSMRLDWKEGCTGNGDLSIMMTIPDYWSNKEGHPPSEEVIDAALGRFKEMFMDACSRVGKS